MHETWKENLKPVIFIVIVLVLAAISAYPQRKFGGTVTEVVDGKTCVIQLGSGQVTVVLQYIEIPEPEQPMHQAVKEHLQKLVLDKTVEFMPRIVMKDRTVGQLVVKGVDVSEQMLRDGAAWYSIPEKSGQEESQSVLYRDNEMQAKAEKRGVWSVENLKPSWEFRAEQAALQKEREEALRNAALVSEMQTRGGRRPVTRQQSAPVEMWADVGGANAFDQPLGLGGLRAGYDAQRKIGHISTPSIFLDFPGAGLLQKLDSRLFYLYKGDKKNIEDSVYVLGFIATSREYKFAKANNLTITADAQRIVLGKAKRLYRKNGTLVQELLMYKVPRAALLKIVKAEKISVQIADHKGGLSAESLTLINNLLSAS